MSDEWFGYVVIIDPVNSEIAKRLNITHPGRYALRVR
jgi:DNA-directed RNA polymerase subunit E"